MRKLELILRQDQPEDPRRGVGPRFGVEKVTPPQGLRPERRVRALEVQWRELFDGVALLIANMPRSYVPTLFAVKLPEILLLLGATGTAAALLGVFRRELAAPDRAALMLVAIAATLPFAITVVMRPAMYYGIRHFVFVTPPLGALGGLAGAWLLKWAHQVGRFVLLATMAAIVALAMLPAVDMIRLHPYQYTHFNHLFGGSERRKSTICSIIGGWCLSKPLNGFA